MQNYFDLQQQIVRLFVDKSIMFEHTDLDVAKKMLRDHNYRNWVSASKVKFAEPVGSKWILYKTAMFQEWKDYFEMDCRVSKHLMGNLVDFERTINSRISHHISELMVGEELSNFERNAIVQIISQTRNRKEVKFSDYTGEQSWRYIHKMTFGEMKILLFWLCDNIQDVYKEIVKEYTFLTDTKISKVRINEINRLRNSLFHFRPLNVYLVHGNGIRKGQKFNNKTRKAVVQFIFSFNRDKAIEKEIKEIIFYTNNYVKIKNSRLLID